MRLEKIKGLDKLCCLYTFVESFHNNILSNKNRKSLDIVLRERERERGGGEGRRGSERESGRQGRRGARDGGETGETGR